MTHRSEARDEQNDAILDLAENAREQAQATIRDVLLAALKNGKLSYQDAIAKALDAPSKLWGYPLLKAAIVKASNAPHEAHGLSGHLKDINAVLPALRQIYDQPYAYELFEQIASWAPREVLAHADCYAETPYGVPLITYAMKQALDQAEQSNVSRSYGQLPVECLFALTQLKTENLKIARKQPEFAAQVCRYERLHKLASRNYTLPEEISTQHRNLIEAFTSAQETVDHPLPPLDPQILVLSSPSGGGKTTQRRFLLADDPRREFLVSYTTRMPRPGEIDGVDYHFLRLGRTEEEARAEFNRLVAAGKIYEQADFYGNLYGTPREQLEKGLAAGKQMIADVNLEGLRAFQREHKGITRGIFLMPPSLEVLKERLIARITNAGDNLSPETRERLEQDVEKRMEQAPAIIRESRFYDTVIDQTGCSPTETWRLLQKSLETPLSEVAGYSIVRLRQSKTHQDNAQMFR